MLADAILVIQLALGLVFAVSSTAKLRAPKVLARAVADYRIVPDSVDYPLGCALIAAEVLLAITHLTGCLLAIAIPLGFGMLTSFAVAVSVNLGRGRSLPCHCFGGNSQEQISLHTLTRVLLLTGAELFLLAKPNLFSRSQIIYPGRIASLSQVGLAFFWALFLLAVFSWILNLHCIRGVFGRQAWAARKRRT